MRETCAIEMCWPRRNREILIKKKTTGSEYNHNNNNDIRIPVSEVATRKVIAGTPVEATGRHEAAPMMFKDSISCEIRLCSS